jgi:hypothetical protein
MKITKQQLIEAAKKSGFTDEDYGLIYSVTAFDKKIGVDEYACGELLLNLFANLGIEVLEDEA